MNYIDEFKTDLQYVKNYSNNTVKAYESDLLSFQKFLNNKDISRVSSEDIQKYMHSFGDKTDKTLARALTTLRMFYDFLIRRNIIKESPMDGIASPKIGKYLPDVLSIDEVDRLLDIKPKNNFEFRNKCILELLYSTGLRISELVSLKFENINLDNSLIRVMGKGSKERIVPLGDYAVNIMNDYMNNYRPLINVLQE